MWNYMWIHWLINWSGKGNVCKKRFNEPTRNTWWPFIDINRAVEKYLSLPSASFPHGCFRPNFMNIPSIVRLCRMWYIRTLRLSRPSPYSQLTTKLNNYMEESRSWEANSSSGSSKITHTVINPKVHHAVRKSVSSVPTTNHTTKAHAP